MTEESTDKLVYGWRIVDIGDQGIVIKEKDPPKSNKNKVKVKKMVIADPGLLLDLDFESEEQLRKIEIAYFVDVPDEDEPYTHVLDLVIDGAGNRLDISNPYRFVVPFVHVEIGGITKKVKYKIEVTYHQFNGDDTTTMENEGELISTISYILSPNHIFEQKIAQNTAHSVIVEKSTLDHGYIYQSPTYQEAANGVSGTITYPSLDANFNTEIANTDDTYSGVRSGYMVYKEGTNHEVNLTKAFYLPYPRLADHASANDPSKYDLKIGDEATYGPGDGFSPYSDQVTIGLLPQGAPHPGEPGV